MLRPGPRPFHAHKQLCSDVGASRSLPSSYLLPSSTDAVPSPLAATLRIFPGITHVAVRAFLSPSGGVRGVVLESYGAGNAPKRPELLAAFQEATDRGVVIVNVTQCAKGAVSAIYATGRALAAAGVVPGADMTTECALAKLSYLLSKPELSPAQVRALIAQPLRGELTPLEPVPAYSQPANPETRLRTLFSQLVECAPSPQRPRRASSTTYEAGDKPILPQEFSASWPSTLADEETLRAAVLPHLLAQAATKPGELLHSLLSSVAPPTTASITSTSLSSLALPSLLNEPASTTFQTPLHLATLAGILANVELLLASGASVHLRDANGRSPLFYAARHRGPDALAIVKALRAAGAHFSERELEAGDVGLEVAKAEKAADAGAKEVWLEALGEEGVGRAKVALRALLDQQ